MPNYKFKVHDVSSGSEKLGAAVLADDDEALGFAQRVIRELVQGDAIYAKATMEVVTGKREVARIKFESAPRRVLREQDGEVVLQVTGIGPTMAGRNGGGDLYYTDGEVWILRLVEACRKRTSPSTIIASPAATEIKDQIWQAIAHALRK